MAGIIRQALPAPTPPAAATTAAASNVETGRPAARALHRTRVVPNCSGAS